VYLGPRLEKQTSETFEIKIASRKFLEGTVIFKRRGNREDGALHDARRVIVPKRAS